MLAETLTAACDENLDLAGLTKREAPASQAALAAMPASRVCKPADADTNDALATLTAYGEQFMSMFDDDDDSSQQAKGRKRISQLPQGSELGQDSASQPHKVKKTVRKSSLSNNKQGKASQQEVKAPDQQGGQQPVGTSEQGRQHIPGKRPRDHDVEEILFTFGQTSKQRKQQQPNQNQMTASQHVHSSSRTAASTAATPSLSAAAAATAKRERKLFMSAKADKVHESPLDVRQDASTLDEEEPGMQLTPQEFKALQSEVERLGATALDKKQRKQWQAAMLQRLGARPDRAPKTAAAIGKGMAVAKKDREAKQLEEAIQAGMIKRKGLGKKKRLDKERNRDAGLQELGRSYKAGVLRLKKGIRSKPATPGGKPGGKGKRGGARKQSLPF